nr:hypothetical protein [Tanacetum cinerariifolium]
MLLGLDAINKVLFLLCKLCQESQDLQILEASARKKRGDSDTSLTPPIATPTLITIDALVPRLSVAAKGKQPAKAKSSYDLSKAARTEAEQLKIVLRRSRQKTHISQHGGSNTNEGTEDTESGRGGDEVTESERESDEEETRRKEDESFDLIPRTPKGSKDEGNDEEDQDIRLSEEARIQEKEKADEVYRDVDINQGSGLQVSQNIEDSHVTLTPVHPDGLQESSSVSSFVTNEQRNLYKALVEAYDADKTILDTYGESTILKRRREDDDQEGPSVGSDRGSKRQREGGEHASASTPFETTTGSADRSTTGSQSRQLSASESAFAEEPVQTTCQMEEPSHPVFEIGAKDQPIIQTSQHPEWFSQPKRPPTPDRDWNKTLPATQGNAQAWISALAKQTNARSSFNELLDTPIDFSNFIMNWLGVDTLTPKLLAGPTYELMRGSWKLSNLTVEKRFAFNVSLRMFTRSIVIHRRVEDLQLGVESYQEEAQPYEA